MAREVKRVPMDFDYPLGKVEWLKMIESNCFVAASGGVLFV